MNRGRYIDAILVISGIVSGLIGNYDSPAGEISKIVPATYAFVIWAPIYLSGLYFVWCLIRRTDENVSLGVHLLAISFFLSGLWVRVQASISLQLVVVAINLIVVLIQGHLLSKVSVSGRRDYLAVGLPSGMLAAWLTLATAVTFSDGLKISFREDATVAIYVAFVVGFALSAAKWIVPTLTYRLTIIWGLVGIVVAQHSQASRVASVASVGAIALLFLVATSRSRRRETV